MLYFHTVMLVPNIQEGMDWKAVQKAADGLLIQAVGLLSIRVTCFSMLCAELP